MPAFIPHELTPHPGTLAQYRNSGIARGRSSAGEACHSPLTAGFSIMKKLLSTPTARSRSLSVSGVS